MNTNRDLLDFTKLKFDIIIAAGQSNCQGSGKGEVANPFVPKENIWYMNRDFTISQATEKVQENAVLGAFKLSFSDEYIKNGLLEIDRHLIIIDCAKGATGFEIGMWGENQVLTLDMLSMTQAVLNLNKNNKIVAFLWHQGERSVNHNLSLEFHSSEMRILLKQVQTQFGNKFPLIAGDFVPVWKESKGKQAVLIADANKNIFVTEFGGGFVETKGLLSNSQSIADSKDEIHFSRQSSIELGIRYFEKYIELINAK